eukprot:2011417-Rhodomonas_salina.1
MCIRDRPRTIRYANTVHRLGPYAMPYRTSPRTIRCASTGHRLAPYTVPVPDIAYLLFQYGLQLRAGGLPYAMSVPHIARYVSTAHCLAAYATSVPDIA